MPLYEKFALLLGCNYPETPFALSGCINDVNSIRTFLLTKRGFIASNIATVTDKQMTLYNMRVALATIAIRTHTVAKKGRLPAVFLMYSGHGTQVTSRALKVYGLNDSDGHEALVPYDVNSSGLLVDDELQSTFINRLHPNTQLFILTDCCNSGSNFDLAYQGTELMNTTSKNSARVIQLSGCKDNEYAIESGGRGLLTTRFLRVIGPAVGKLAYFRQAMNDLSISGNPQHPQVSVSNRMVLKTGTLFPWLIANVKGDAPRVVVAKMADKAQRERLAKLKKKLLLKSKKTVVKRLKV